ncbi:hypothetical protein SAMN04488511_107101 [Pedobacter suwonensis]|uniref:Uncharacterized protein n=1 Tax=Pedobacter suwonensis TaxID=332999 RepID=A0A1I0T9D4_9SPHI|nr:DUF6515 family protein [Pedobacter suwonensis]SFA48385.1 hypothetical protein SAMN04488511_107101 [Pedobacter suwonensis]
MNGLFNKVLVVFAAAAMITTWSIESVSAQRPSRSGGGASFGGGRSGSVGSSRGGGFSHQPTLRGPGRGGFSTGVRSGRSSYSYYRPGYRMGYGRPYYGYRVGFGRPYYRPYYNYYSFYRPFLGVRINVLPYGYYPFWYGPTQFYYSGGLFYQQNNDQYEVVTPPVGAEVPNLPSDANRVTINGVDYYEYKGVYYTQKENAEGKTVYVVAGKDGVLNTANGLANTHNIGDIIDQLPEGCREVTIKNEKYFVSPDDVYYEEVVDGNNITYRVIGKLF